SRRRGEPDFRDVEDQWAKDAIDRARRLDDGDKDRRRALLVQVSQAKEVNDDLRKKATELLDAEKGSTVNALTLVEAGAPDAGVKHRWDAGVRVWEAGVPAAPTPTTATTTTTSTTTADPLAADQDRAREAMKRQVLGSAKP